MMRHVLVVAVAAMLTIPFAGTIAKAAGGSEFGVQKTIQLATGQLTFFDLTWVDQKQRVVYIADSGNGAIDIFDAKKNKLITQFIPTPHFAAGGPNGMMVTSDTHQIYVGDPASTAWHIDASNPAAPKVVAMIPTGGAGDTDEESYDPTDGLVLITNPHETIPFISLIGTTGPNADKVVKKINFANAAPGVSMFGSALEQSVYDPETSLFYIQLQQTVSGPGEIDSIDPKTFAVKTVVSTGNCVGTGLSFDEKHQRLILGCSGEVAVATPANSDLFMAYDLGSGELTTIAGPTGNSDEAWFDPHNGFAYVANAAYITDFNSGAINASVGVIDTVHNDTVLNFRTGDTTGATILHSLAVDEKNNHVFVPLAVNSLAFDNDPTKKTSCTNGCLAVLYGKTPKDTDGD